MEPVVERFLRYVSFDTQSDEHSDSCPSTDKQKLLGAALVTEMREMGIGDARMDEQGYVYGSIPGDPDLPAIGLIAHMDTSPDASGANIRPRIMEYTGEDLCLNAEKGIYLRESDYPALRNHVGKHLIVTDGTTLLGADDKAGIAEILTAAEEILCRGERHATVKIALPRTRKSAAAQTALTWPGLARITPIPQTAVRWGRSSTRISTLPVPR